MARTRFTPRKRQVYNFIVKFKKTHDGNSPTVAEICQICNVSSTSVASYYLKGLEGLGLIKLGGSRGRRMIEVPGGKWTPPTMPVVLNDADAHKLLEVVKG